MLTCNESKPYIFISYAHKDGEKVKAIIEKLIDSGYNVWWDEGIDPGTEWDENIAAHVQGCGYFVAFVSNAYIDSKNCKDELNYSRDLDKDQLLVYLEDVELPSGMAMRMNRIQAIFWNKYKDENEAFGKLCIAKGIEVTKLDGESIDSTSISKPAKKAKVKSDKKFPKWAIGVIAGVVVVAAVLAVVLLGGKNKISKELRLGLDYLHGTNGQAYDPVKALEIFKAEADKGDMDAALLAGYVLDFDLLNTTSADDEAAIKYLESCKEEKPGAELLMGVNYYKGIGVDKDAEEAEKLFKDAVSKIDAESVKAGKVTGSAEICMGLGYYYWNAKERDYGAAKDWFETAVVLGNNFGNEYIGYIYENGNGVTKNYATALDYISIIADKGNAIALNEIGYLYSVGDESNGVAKSMNKAVEYYEKAANAGSIYAMDNLADKYWDGALTNGEPEYDKAFPWYEKAAEYGYAQSLRTLGFYYRDGLGSIEPNINKAIEYYTQAAEKDDVNATRQLGNIYYKDKYDMQNYELAIEWYKKGADLGDAWSIYYLSDAYLYGKGVDKNIDEAKKYYDRVSAMNDLDDDLKKNLETFKKQLDLSDTSDLEGKSTVELVELARAYEEKKDYANAFRVWKYCEPLDDTNYATYICGWIYAFGKAFQDAGAVSKDYDIAISHFTKCVEAGKNDGTHYAIACAIHLGDVYSADDNPGKDYKKAREYYEWSLKMCEENPANNTKEYIDSLKKTAEAGLAKLPEE